MAQFGLPPGLCLLALGLTLAAPLTWAGSPIIRLIDQGGPLIEGSNVVLECLSEEGGEDLSGFTFQKYSKWLHSWITLNEATELRCWFYDVAVSHDDGRLLLTINDVQSWHTGLYRCASSNSTDNASFSNELDLQTEYLRSVYLSQANTWCGTVGNSITILAGKNLELRCLADASQPPLYEWTREGEDWIVASDALTLAKVTREQEGTYVCQAQHPTLPQLSKSKSIHLFVEGSKRAFTFDSVMSLSTPMLALVVALPAVLLVLVIMVIAFVIPRRRAKKKAAQEDAGQRTPIYKGSLDSVPSVVADTHPLVM
uniref:Cell surface glycoprotein MUC18-like n=1 Tax=Pogona vitticeps TaxID=103695 RepID=A0ABM5ETH9_9SAUR